MKEWMIEWWLADYEDDLFLTRFELGAAAVAIAKYTGESYSVARRLAAIDMISRQPFFG